MSRFTAHLGWDTATAGERRWACQQFTSEHTRVVAQRVAEPRNRVVVRDEVEAVQSEGICETVDVLDLVVVSGGASGGSARRKRRPVGGDESMLRRQRRNRWREQAAL